MTVNKFYLALGDLLLPSLCSASTASLKHQRYCLSNYHIFIDIITHTQNFCYIHLSVSDLDILQKVNLNMRKVGFFLTICNYDIFFIDLVTVKARQLLDIDISIIE